ncbi:S-layer homology domain-containing protein [Pontibacillus yanchengensis]
MNDGYFKPHEPMTRGEMAIVLQKAFNLNGISNKSFNDVSAGHKAYEVIQALAKNKITNGYLDGIFKSGNILTRAHSTVFMARSMSNYFISGKASLHSKNVIVWSDYFGVYKTDVTTNETQTLACKKSPR